MLLDPTVRHSASLRVSATASFVTEFFFWIHHAPRSYLTLLSPRDIQRQLLHGSECMKSYFRVATFVWQHVLIRSRDQLSTRCYRKIEIGYMQLRETAVAECPGDTSEAVSQVTFAACAVNSGGRIRRQITKQWLTDRRPDSDGWYTVESNRTTTGPR